MSDPLSKVMFDSTYDAFKNDGTLYTGSISFPTTLTSAQQYTTNVPVNISKSPQFSKFYANFVEYYDAQQGVGSAQWYDEIIAGSDIGIHVTAPAAQVSWINCTVYPIILGNQIFVTASVINPYSVTVTLAALTVPFAFIEYTLAD